jgi:hypothetical protein
MEGSTQSVPGSGTAYLAAKINEAEDAVLRTIEA